MNAVGGIKITRSANAAHFAADGLEFLEIRRGGECIIRSTAPDGTEHSYVQHHPNLLKMLVSVPGRPFAIALQDIPPSIAEHFLIPSVIVLFPSANTDACLLMAREPLGTMQLRLLRNHLGPIYGILVGKSLYQHKDDIAEA